jgi:hypothetical protein
LRNRKTDQYLYVLTPQSVSIVQGSITLTLTSMKICVSSVTTDIEDTGPRSLAMKITSSEFSV